MANNRFTKTLLLSSLLIFIAGNFSYAAEHDGSSAPDSTSALHNVVLAKDPSVPSVAQLVSLYEDRDFRPIWSGDGEGARIAGEVRALLAHADRQGLRPEDYISPVLLTDKAPKQAKRVAEYDVALTEGLLRYAHDVRSGLPPHDVYKDVLLPSVDFDAEPALKHALRAHAFHTFLVSLPPQRAEYRALVAALATYRTIAAKGGWPTIKVAGKAAGEIDLEGDDPRVKALIKRLALEDPVLGANPQPMPEDIQDAIIRFQTRNGIEPDGRIGGDTLAALNVPASVRADEIKANLERWRWMAYAFEHRYVAVNVPDQSLDMMVDGQSVLRSKVIIGKKATPTPITRMVAQTVIANPPWTIPSDIAARMILPHLKQSSDYLASRNMVLVDRPEGSDPRGADINWRDVNKADFNYQLVQSPGPDNALGTLMLDSPNEFGVYLHDTPKKKLFDQPDREASNGCIRVQGIYPLASWALSNDAMGASEQLDAAIDTGQTQTITLDEPLPIYVLYWTAIPQDDGTVGFRPDLYGRDRKLLAAMSNRKEHDRRQLSAMLTTAEPKPETN
jgi:murein L,D-transpeptidase YcbB/YkuD